MRAATLALALVLAVSGTARAGWSRIGRSVEDRAIGVFDRGDPGARHSVLVVGCIHGNECAGKAVVRRLRKIAIPDNVRVWLVPDLNPDGSRAGTRQNANGVDLNRNFSRGWEPIGEPGDTFHSGPRPFSEPESRAARSLVREIQPDITLWFHQQMSLIVRQPRHRKVQRRYARLVGLPLKDIGKLPGTASRWQNHRFPDDISFVVELPGGSMSNPATRRHARAILKIAPML